MLAMREADDTYLTENVEIPLSHYFLSVMGHLSTTMGKIVGLLLITGLSKCEGNIPTWKFVLNVKHSETASHEIEENGTFLAI